MNKLIIFFGMLFMITSVSAAPGNPEAIAYKKRRIKNTIIALLTCGSYQMAQQEKAAKEAAKNRAWPEKHTLQ